MKLTPMGKVIVVVALLVAAVFSVRQFAPNLLDKLVPAAKSREADDFAGMQKRKLGFCGW